MTLKLGLVILLLVPLLWPGLEQYAGKGMSWRVFVFPLAALTIPVLWRLTGSCPPYPYLADALLVVPALTDVLWNTLDTYDRVDWWDDVNHLVNSVMFAAVIGLWAGRYHLGAVNCFALALGLGMTLQVLWEIGEYFVFLTHEAGGFDRYADTIRDLSVDLGGSLAGAALALVLARAAMRRSGLDVMSAPAAMATPSEARA